MASTGLPAHLALSLKLQEQSPTFPGKSERFHTGSYDPKYQDHVWSVAVNIKKHIDRQMQELKQGSNFLDIEPMFTVDAKRKRVEEGSSSSFWTKEKLIPFQIYYVPMINWDAIVPQEYLPTQKELEEQYGLAFDPTHDEAFLSDFSKIATIKDKPLRQLYTSIYILLKKDPMVAQSTVDSNDIDKREGKKEVMTGALFRKVAEFIGINDPADCKLVLIEERAVKASLGEDKLSGVRSYTCINEFVIVEEQEYHSGAVLGFAEDKRLLFPNLKSLPTTIAQKASECLAVALEGFSLSADPKDQEVFCIGVRHLYFSFWHIVFAAEYLSKVSKHPGTLTPTDFAWLKTYPVSEFGLNICNPQERLEIFRGFVAIKKYVQSGKARIGNYEL
eukprot:Phypoly_transcript_03921.p1 GENE.Phypoly_transcript_03921~~Phypoly_transcript_03921.p1  ORF type:complete len:389 (+),score=59.39 Phypoly_transcript_03921:1101-2267(+)